MPQVFSALVVSFTVPLLFVLFRRLLPYTSPRPLSPEQLRILARQYRWVNFAMLPVYITTVAVVTTLATLLLGSLAEWRLAALPPAVFLLKPEPYWAMWLVPSFFLGLIGAPLAVELTLRLVLRQRYAEYTAVSQARAGFDARKVLFILSGVIGVLVAGFVVLGMDWYTRFDEERVAVNGLLGWGERVYSYGDVDKVVQATHLKAPNGDIVERTRWFILFTDGRRWCNEDLIRSGPNLDDGPLIEFVCRKAGKPLMHARFVEDVAGP